MLFPECAIKVFAAAHLDGTTLNQLTQLPRVHPSVSNLYKPLDPSKEKNSRSHGHYLLEEKTRVLVTEDENDFDFYCVLVVLKK